jgi:hypothetical protein
MGREERRTPLRGRVERLRAIRVPGSSAIFLSELEAERPAVVIDVPKSMGGRSIMGFPAFADYVKGYCRPTMRDRVAIFERLDPGEICPTP